MNSDLGRAVLHRMVMPGHTCPYGLKARHLLRSRGYAVEDHHLATRGLEVPRQAGLTAVPITAPQSVRRAIGGADLRQTLG